MGCMENNNVGGVENNERRCHHGRPNFFPDTIKELLEKLECDWVVLGYINGNREKVKVEAVTDDLVIVREQNTFRCINMGCICSVCVNSDTILSSLLNSNCD